MRGKGRKWPPTVGEEGGREDGEIALGDGDGEEMEGKRGEKRRQNGSVIVYERERGKKSSV